MSKSELQYRLGYIPALNGLRGLAILAVVAYHGGVHVVSSGMLGVDLFFVISGFLITALLVREFDQSLQIRLPKFYARRILRLLPALVIACTVYTGVACTIDPSHYIRHLQDAGIALVYAGNWARAFGLDRPDWLGHTWSLAIEEQYYLIWPLLLLFFLRKSWSRQRLALIVGGIGVASWCWRSVYLFIGASQVRVYNGLDTRLDGLMIGSALAILFSKTTPTAVALFIKANACTGPLAAAVFFALCLMFRLDSNNLYYFGFGLANIMAAVMIMNILVHPQEIFAKVLSWKPLVWVGDRSYGIYLWHLLIIRLSMKFHVTYFSLVLLLTFCVAELSYRWIELPALRLKQRIR